MFAAASKIAGFEKVLPAAYYYLSAKPLKDSGCFTSLDHFWTWQRGREALKDLQRESIWKINPVDTCCNAYAYSSGYSSTCFQPWIKFLDSHSGKQLLRQPNIFSFKTTHCTAAVCENFRSRFEEHLKRSQNTIWSEFPQLFGLDPWEKLKGWDVQ